LETLCRAYWFPLYAYGRRRGYGPDDAEDLTQDFFAHLLSNNSLAGVDPGEGKLRSFLLASLTHFLANWEKYKNAKKRGGGNIPLSLDVETAEGLYRAGSGTPLTAEEEYNRRWTIRLLEQAFAALEHAHTSDGNAPLFAELKVFLEQDRTAPGEYKSASEKLRMTPNRQTLAVSIGH
jgi:RNA polymerase sigma-70 factor (ECF subfamily)